MKNEEIDEADDGEDKDVNGHGRFITDTKM